MLSTRSKDTGPPTHWWRSTSIAAALPVREHVTSSNGNTSQVLRTLVVIAIGGKLSMSTVTPSCPCAGSCRSLPRDCALSGSPSPLCYKRYAAMPCQCSAAPHTCTSIGHLLSHGIRRTYRFILRGLCGWRPRVQDQHLLQVSLLLLLVLAGAVRPSVRCVLERFHCPFLCFCKAP